MRTCRLMNEGQKPTFYNCIQKINCDIVSCIIEQIKFKVIHIICGFLFFCYFLQNRITKMCKLNFLISVWMSIDTEAKDVFVSVTLNFGAYCFKFLSTYAQIISEEMIQFIVYINSCTTTE